MLGGVAMSLNDLEAALDKSIEDFKTYVQSNYTENSSTAVTHADLREYSSQIYYSLNDFKKNIIEFLEKH